MFSMCSELAPRAHIPDTRIPQLMQPWLEINHFLVLVLSTFSILDITTPNITMTLMTQVGGVVSVLVVIAIIVLVGALVHR